MTQARQVPLMSSQGYGGDEAVSDSSDEEIVKKSNIPPSVFGQALQKYGYGDPGTERTNTTSGNRYAASIPVASYNVKPKPRETPMAMQDVDYHLRDAVKALMASIPEASIRRCDDALQKCNGNVIAAQGYILDKQEKEAKQKMMTMVDLTTDIMEDPTRQQGSFKRPGSKPSARVQVEDKRSIMDKYLPGSSTTSKLHTPNLIPISSSPVKPSTPQPVRRRLQQGRRNRSPSVETPLSPVEVEAPPPRAAANKARKRLVESDHDEDEEVEAEETDEEVLADEAIDLTNDTDSTEHQLLEQLNTCSIADLVDLSMQPRDVAEIVLSKRPFNDLDDVRAITIDVTSVSKNGKQRINKKKVGDRLVDVCLEMFEGYNAVDQLVEHCQAIAEPIAVEMKNMGMDLLTLQSGGELSFTDIDSGIGTPCSSSADEDLVPSTSLKKALSQPSNMSKEVTMKDYQIAGLNWLALMWRKKLSCILADDMGLGKTCQVISFISHLVEIGINGTHLVVVPGSTIQNWLNEFESFSPGVMVIPYYGSMDERAGARGIIQEKIDDRQLSVIVTTYDTAVKKDDNRFLRRLNVALCVFDEGHALKNSSSQRYTELMRIPAQMRLLLTGTPLQNNLQELVSLLAFIMPKIFREHSQELEYIFKHKAKVSEAASSEALLSQQRIRRARSMMTPFILRRKKAQVLKHLPAKHCRVEYCDMSADQAIVYNSEVTKVQELLKARALAKAAGDKKPTWTIKGKVNNLIDLREAAIHPLLLRTQFTDAVLHKMVKACRDEEEFNALTKDKDKRIFEMFDKYSDYELHQFCQGHACVRRFDPITNEEEAILNSGKVTKLVELLLSHRANGDRTLVFSRFTMVLDILDVVLSIYNLRFCRLDGSTQIPQRQELINEFYRDADISVFMLSTGAGGAGINLAAANKVIIFDMSFNPQDDLQAENRAHRIGQTREVEVVRLVAKGTVEEQIYRLGQTKMALDERVAGNSGASQAAEIDEKAAESKIMDMLFQDLKKEEDEVGDQVHGKAEGAVKKEEGDDHDTNMKDVYGKALRSAGVDVKLEA